MKSSLQTFTTAAALHTELAKLRSQQKTLCLVPTMGNLHAGHLRLIAEAKRHADVVIASIFVNPIQFGPSEDLDSYPRTLVEDQAKLEQAGCNLLFAPAVAEIYPHGHKNLTLINVPEASQGLCGASRPGHFQGVATVVAKLFNIVRPDIACFGEKDYQQLAVIKKLVTDLSYPIQIIGVPTQRAASGLALSSRNNYLTAAEATKAASIYRILKQTAQQLAAGNVNFHQLVDSARANLAEQGLAPEYVEIRNTNLAPANPTDAAWVILVAAKLGTTRLIDNLTVKRSNI